jgi:hypothetical protein
MSGAYTRPNCPAIRISLAGAAWIGSKQGTLRLPPSNRTHIKTATSLLIDELLLMKVVAILFEAWQSAYEMETTLSLSMRVNMFLCRIISGKIAVTEGISRNN